jgi:hypothetical protein
MCSNISMETRRSYEPGLGGWNSLMSAVMMVRLVMPRLLHSASMYSFCVLSRHSPHAPPPSAIRARHGGRRRSVQREEVAVTQPPVAVIMAPVAVLKRRASDFGPRTHLELETAVTVLFLYLPAMCMHSEPHPHPSSSTFCAPVPFVRALAAAASAERPCWFHTPSETRTSPYFSHTIPKGPHADCCASECRFTASQTLGFGWTLSAVL